MIKKNQSTTSSLATWLWHGPARFTAWMIVVSAILFGVSYIPAIMTVRFIDIIITGISLIAFIFVTHGLIKNLPNTDMNQKNFVAIINGYKLLSFILFNCWACLAFFINKHKPAFIAMTGSIQNTQSVFVSDTLMNTIEIIWFALSVYLIGLWISGIYAKYKRAKETGISGWKAILTMPFTFMMSWMPGYLTPDNKQSNLTIKTNWYTKLNKWVVSNANNTILTFLVLFVFTYLFISAQLSTIFFVLILFAIYILWKTVAKEAFSKQINHSYIWTAIIINILMIASFIHMFIMYTQIPK